MNELKSVEGSKLHLMSEEELLKNNHFDNLTYRMLRQIKNELVKDQYDTSVEDALIYCIEYTHENLVEDN